MIEPLWQTGRYAYQLNTLRTKNTVGVHRAVVRWGDGIERDSHLKIVFGHAGLPLRHHVHEAAGWLMARALGLPVPTLSGFIVLNAQQVAAAHPERAPSGDTLAWVTSTEPDVPLPISDRMMQSRQLAKELLAWPHLAAACTFDETLANGDRYPRNLLRLAQNNFLLIDHDNIAGGAHWLADSLVQSRFEDFSNVLRERCAPQPAAPPCPERAFSNDMVGHAERHGPVIATTADQLLHWVRSLLDDESDAWAFCLFLSARAWAAPALIRKRYRLLM